MQVPQIETGTADQDDRVDGSSQQGHRHLPLLRFNGETMEWTAGRSHESGKSCNRGPTAGSVPCATTGRTAARFQDFPASREVEHHPDGLAGITRIVEHDAAFGRLDFLEAEGRRHEGVQPRLPIGFQRGATLDGDSLASDRASPAYKSSSAATSRLRQASSQSTTTAIGSKSSSISLGIRHGSNVALLRLSGKREAVSDLS